MRIPPTTNCAINRIREFDNGVGGCGVLSLPWYSWVAFALGTSTGW